MTTPPLVELLDVSNLHDHSQLSRRFLEIAELILSSHRLRIEYEGMSTEFEILEIEFYLHKEGLHEDPFCHAHQDQMRSAQWYANDLTSSQALLIRIIGIFIVLPPAHLTSDPTRLQQTLGDTAEVHARALT